MQGIGEPKRAWEKNAFPSRQSVHVFFVAITKHESILHELAFDRFDRAADAFIACWQKTGAWQNHKHTGVERVGTVELGKRLLFLVVTAFANFEKNLVADLCPSFEIFVRRILAGFGQLDRAIKH